jgi:hypothetical protein
MEMILESSSSGSNGGATAGEGGDVLVDANSTTPMMSDLERKQAKLAEKHAKRQHKLHAKRAARRVNKRGNPKKLLVGKVTTTEQHVRGNDDDTIIGAEENLSDKNNDNPSDAASSVEGNVLWAEKPVAVEEEKNKEEEMDDNEKKKDITTENNCTEDKDRELLAVSNEEESSPEDPIIIVAEKKTKMELSDEGNNNDEIMLSAAEEIMPLPKNNDTPSVAASVKENVLAAETPEATEEMKHTEGEMDDNENTVDAAVEKLCGEDKDGADLAVPPEEESSPEDPIILAEEKKPDLPEETASKRPDPKKEIVAAPCGKFNRAQVETLEQDAYKTPKNEVTEKKLLPQSREEEEEEDMPDLVHTPTGSESSLRDDEVAMTLVVDDPMMKYRGMALSILILLCAFLVWGKLYFYSGDDSMVADAERDIVEETSVKPSLFSKLEAVLSGAMVGNQLYENINILKSEG